MMNPQYFFLPILQYTYYSNTHCEEILITPTFLWYNHTRKTRKTVVGDDSMIKKPTFVYLLPLEYLYFLFYFFTRSATTCSQLAFQLQLWCIKAAIKLWWESVCWQFATEWGQIDAYLQFVSDNTVINCDIFANIAKLLLSVAISMHGNLY